MDKKRFNEHLENLRNCLENAKNRWGKKYWYYQIKWLKEEFKEGLI